MLLTTIPGGPRCALPPGEDIPAEAVWIDLIHPTEEERAAAERATGLRVPRREEIVEIESSSRLRTEGEGLYLSMPVFPARAGGGREQSALGFVLSPRHLISLRYATLSAFDQYAGPAAPQQGAVPSASVLFGLLGAMVDAIADALERVDGELENVSRRVFHTDGKPARRRREDMALRAVLRRIGLAGDLVSSMRASLLGIGRIVPYVAETAAWLPPDQRSVVASLRQDINSLTDFDTQLMNKVQFLLDATLGFLNLEQNDRLKVLTVVSVVGIPPTLIASMYGMNFKNMPELSWAWGYPYGLTLIALSILLPLIWFRYKAWI